MMKLPQRSISLLICAVMTAVAFPGNAQTAQLTASDPLSEHRSADAFIEFGTPAPPPEWALLQRHLLKRLYPAAIEFVRNYTRGDGTLIWREEWPGMDGSDDGYESFYNFPLYYALGGPEEIYELSLKL